MNYSEGALSLMKRIERDNERKSWAVILGGGDGTRLQPLTRVISGDDRPKQFCSMFGGRTLLDQTRNRVALSVPEEQTLTLVTEHHKPFYTSLVKSNPGCRLLVQPTNKGTAPAILLSLLKVRHLAPDSTVAFFPSDHHITNDVRFMAHVDLAFSHADQNPNMIVLLGMEPETPEVNYGWIQPEKLPSGPRSQTVSHVRAFWEKPDITMARKLLSEGCLWNSFVMIGRTNAFIELIRRALPQLYRVLSEIAPALGTADEAQVLHQSYSLIESTNFSSEVLALWPSYLLVSRVSGVGWSDLGEPERALSAIERSGVHSLPLTGMETFNHRASISYLREYFERISVSRRYERNEQAVRSIGAAGD